MKAFAVRSAFFVGSLFASMFAMDRALAHFITTDVELKYQALFDASAQYRQIVIGTSHAVLGINPRLMEAEGLSLYNFAFGGSNPRYHCRWYELFRSLRPAPALVLVSADWMLFKPQLDRHFEHDSEYWPPSFFARTLLFEPGVSRSTLLMSRFPLFKERDAIQQGLAPSQRRGRYVLERYYKGYVPVEVDAFRWMEPARESPQPAMRQEFERLLDRLEADGAKVVFFQAPEYLPTAGEHPVENAELERIAQARRIPFLNYNAERRSAMNMERRYFIDWGHLNEEGSAIFSRRLAQDLRAIGVIPPVDR